MSKALLRVFLILCVASLLSGYALAQQPAPTPDPDNCTIQIYKSSEVDRKLKILAKPEPKFTRDERQKQAFDQIVLEAVFCGSGKVTNIKVKQGSSDSANEKAIAAARTIEFEPAEKDGQKVSLRLILQYLVR